MVVEADVVDGVVVENVVVSGALVSLKTVLVGVVVSVVVKVVVSRSKDWPDPGVAIAIEISTVKPMVHASTGSTAILPSG